MEFIEFSAPVIKTLLKGLRPDKKALWGQMTAQHMVEHLIKTLKVSTGEIKVKIYTPAGMIDGLKMFLKSGKPLPKLFKAPVELVSEAPPELEYENLETGINILVQEMETFFNYYQNNEGARENHPVFGELDYNEWIIFHRKHFTHHLAQFDISKK